MKDLLEHPLNKVAAEILQNYRGNWSNGILPILNLAASGMEAAAEIAGERIWDWEVLLGQALLYPRWAMTELDCLNPDDLLSARDDPGYLTELIMTELEPVDPVSR